MSFKINTPGAYLVKGTEKIKLGSRHYEADELHGWCSPSHRILVEDMQTREKRIWFPGEAMAYPSISEDLESMTKDELRALMPDKAFLKKITKEKLLEAYHGR